MFVKLLRLALIFALALLALGAPSRAEPFGKQISESGITHSFLITGSLTAIIDEQSEIAWQTAGGSRDGFVLATGNVLVTYAGEVKELTRDGKLVFHYKLSGDNRECGTAVRLEDGRTMVVELGPKPQILELDENAKVVVALPLQPETDNVHMQTRMARKLASGNYLVPHLLAFAVKEYKPDGKVVRTIRTDLEELGGRAAENWPFTAIRLENGNTLVNLTHGNKTVEFDAEGKVAWRVDNADIDGRFADPCGGQRLPSGNTVICSYGQRDPSKPKVFEVNAEKQVVWEFLNPKLAGVHEIHVLSTSGQAIAGAPLK